MALQRPHRFNLERLDDRITPALTVVRNSAAVLNVTGTPTNVLTVTQTAANSLKVTDGATTWGPLNASGGLNIILGGFKQAILVDVGNFTYTGNITIDLGLGSTFKGIREVSIFDGSAGGPLGKVAGNVTVRNGNGSEYISIGRPAATAKIDFPVQVNGSVFVTTKYNSGPDTFELVPASVVQGSVYLTNVDNTSLGVFDPGSPALATVGGSVVISNATPAAAFTADIYATVGGSITMVSNTGSNKLAALAIDDGTTIGGNLTAVLTNGQNFVALGTGVSGQAAPVISGNLNLVLGTSDDTVLWTNDTSDNSAAAVNGTASINLGQGDNSFYFDSFAFVGGSLNVSAGNGANFIGGAATGNLDGTINGNLTVTTGNGDNTVNFGGTVFGTQLIIQTGGGDDSVSIASTAQAPGAKLTALLNGGDDSLNIDSVAFASAYLDGGAGSADTFSCSQVIPINWKIQNFEL